MTNLLSTIVLTALTVWLAAMLAVATTQVERKAGLAGASYAGAPPSATADWPR